MEQLEDKKENFMVNEMVWDLSQLVDSTDLKAIREKLDALAAEASKINEKYRGKVLDMAAEGVLELLKTRDDLKLKFDGTTSYCYLIYAANSTDEVAKQLNESGRQAAMNSNQALAFIDLELGKLLVAKPSLIDNPVLAEYRHFLERILKKMPHMLSETEEKLAIIKDKNGISAWELFQSDWLSTRAFTIEVDGEKTTMPFGQITGLYQSPNRDLRKRAYETIYDVVSKDDIVWASAIRAVCDDHVQMCNIRKWPTPMTQSFIDNDVDEQAIDSLLKTIQKNAGLYQRYLKLKAKLMKMPKLANYDLWAPLPQAPSATFSWTDSRNEVTSAYAEFDQQIGNWIVDMYERRHLDGEPRKGKTAGAFCSSWLAGKSAYILQSFNGRMMDVYTQAHELGHAIHDYLMSRAQRPTNCDVGSCVAETGSIFGELLLTERLLQKAKTKEEQQAILSVILDEFGNAAFLVSARVFLEQALYDNLKQGQLLDGETVCKLWVTARNAICGDAVDWLDILKWGWATTPHYYISNYRFYNYPYVYAQLFVYALYRLYKEKGKEFIPKLKALLAAGSSKSPRDLANELGFDITSEEFWQKGMNQYEEFINTLEKTM
jgi:oligoendopeptidase F